MPNILIVDDEAGMREVISAILEKQGYNTLTAEDGGQAVSAVGKNKIDLVILDIHLPDKDGVEILEEIKKINKNLPVIMCSGFDDVNLAVESVKSGAFDYIRKPFDNKELIEKVGTALSKEIIKTPENARAVPVKAIKPGKKTSKARVYGAGCILVILGTLIALKAFIFTGNGTWKVHKIPCANPTSISCGQESGNKYLWISDWPGQSIWKHNIDSGLSLAKVYHLPINWPNGLAVGNGYIWTSENVTRKIYRHICDDNLTISAVYDSPGPNPVALCWDGTFLWSCDADRKKIFRHKLDYKLSVIDAYNYPGIRPIAIFWDGKNIFTADAETNKVYKHNMDESLSVAAEYLLEPFKNGMYKISGAAFDGENIWFSVEGVKGIYKCALP